MKLRMEAVAMFWEGDNPNRARIAAEAISPLYADEKPGQSLVLMRSSGHLYLGFMADVSE